MALIRLKQINKTYVLGKGAVTVHALRRIDLSIDRGEYIAVMGPSGSGKSTLLNILGCLDRPTDGQYMLDGQDVSGLDDDALSGIRCRKLGFIFQSYNLIPELSILENIEMPLYYQGQSERASREKALELAERVGLTDRIHHKPAELSGGQQQRVAIARALVNDSLIILADEPTGNLDSETTGDILQILDRLHQNGKTLITVTHDREVGARAQRIIRMRDGRIEKDA
ncbi:MAG: ABC transporter ATP-binding protein [Desulfobacterales bacterium]|nr:ABC transporter ATP-binding protein [Desulfobacterales bacterium]MDD4391576.1 ABC transporter ATP-binding protein [Desulfobacterales bacterium]